jgi:hypothetical protein
MALKYMEWLMNWDFETIQAAVWGLGEGGRASRSMFHVKP